MSEGAHAKVTAKLSARGILGFFAAAWKRDFGGRSRRAKNNVSTVDAFPAGRKRGEAETAMEKLKSEPDDIVVTPKEAEQLFENARGVILDALVRKVQGFDIHADRERYWQLVDCGVRVEKLTNPVRLESVLSIIDEFTALAFRIALTQEEGELHAHFH